MTSIVGKINKNVIQLHADHIKPLNLPTILYLLPQNKISCLTKIAGKLRLVRPATNQSLLGKHIHKSPYRIILLRLITL